MLFHKSLVSFVTAIALASSVAASATPVRRTYPPEPTQNCPVSDQRCCTGDTSFGGLGVLGPLLKVAFPALDVDLIVGLTCTLTGTVACGTQQSLCCSAVQNQVGLVNVGLNCVPIAV